MRLSEIITEAAALVTMYHGTALENVPSILKHGLRPSDKSNASDDRWATLGGVYLTSSFDYALKAARNTYPDQPLAVIVVRTSIAKAMPDEDVVEKALIKAFTSALDVWGIDDAYEGDLEMYARAEEEKPLDYDEKPFDRAKFFRDFWNTVMVNMSQIAGTPRRRDPETVKAAVDMAIELNDDDVREYVNLTQWQAVKERLVALYPRLRSIEQHTNAGLTIAHNVRMTKPIRRNQIVDVMTKQNGKWTSMKMVEAIVVKDDDVVVHKNPSRDVFHRLLLKSVEQSLRGTVLDRGGGDLLVWDAYYATHDVVDDYGLGGDGLRIDIDQTRILCLLQGSVEEIKDWSIQQERMRDWSIDPNQPNEILARLLKAKALDYLKANQHLRRAWGGTPPVDVDMKF